MANPELLAIIRKTQISAAMPADERVKFLKLAWDFRLSPESGVKARKKIAASDAIA